MASSRIDQAVAFLGLVRISWTWQLATALGSTKIAGTRTKKNARADIKRADPHAFSLPRSSIAVAQILKLEVCQLGTACDLACNPGGIGQAAFGCGIRTYRFDLCGNVGERLSGSVIYRRNRDLSLGAAQRALPASAISSSRSPEQAGLQVVLS